ncbi:hypothetical protein [Paenibacillus sp. L3-i20]|uniref:hypothetical protein n=1 Tax=Paenibacillus sp. L3-i20 TaxID=2905833 RepID=UPI001EDCACD9|nr:hypothetical protein [Paenibacillus sp. L3-i20]GKU80475.1 hypothetical protein L3i20_v248720 [Paenibacillus sp. L3-i20]
MAKNKLLFRTPREGFRLRPGTTRIVTENHHHDHHHHHHKDEDQNNDNNNNNNNNNNQRNRGIDVRKYRTIRVNADNRFTSVSSVVFSLVIIENGRRVGILERFRLAPGETFSRTFNVPGEFLEIRAHALRKRNCRNNRRRDTIDVSVFGHK